MYGIMYSEPMFFSSADKLREFEDACISLGKHLMILRAASEAKGDRRYQVSWKCHLAQHLPQQAKLLNPRYTQVYSEEALVGSLTRIWARSCSGPYKRTVQRTAMLKYLALVALQLEL